MMADEGLLRRAAERASQQQFYLASALLPYARAVSLDDAELATALGCTRADLPSLLLCRRPTGEGAVFRADVEAIARRFSLSAIRLGQIIRTADALVAFEGAGSEARGGLLAAARDREHQDSQPAGDTADQASTEASSDEDPR